MGDRGISAKNNVFFFLHVCRSTSCPDCRKSIGTVIRVFLNVSDRSDIIDKLISDAATFNRMNETILRYEIKQLEDAVTDKEHSLLSMSMQCALELAKLQMLKKATQERNRELIAVKKKLRELEMKAKNGIVEIEQLKALVIGKYRTITELYSTIKSTGAKHIIKLKKMSINIAILKQQMLDMNDCIDAMNLRTQCDKILKRRMPRSRAQQIESFRKLIGRQRK